LITREVVASETLASRATSTSVMLLSLRRGDLPLFLDPNSGNVFIAFYKTHVHVLILQAVFEGFGKDRASLGSF